jgi:hypothetical protein
MRWIIPQRVMRTRYLWSVDNVSRDWVCTAKGISRTLESQCIHIPHGAVRLLLDRVEEAGSLSILLRDVEGCESARDKNDRSPSLCFCK